MSEVDSIPPRRRAAVRVMAGAVPLLLAALVLAGCTPDAQSSPSASADAQTSSPTATGNATPTTAPAGQLDPEGTAAQNQGFFDATNQALIARNPAAGGQDFTSNLRDAGFDIAAMQVTPDITTVGVAADSIQFSVKWTDACLVGQYGQGVYSSSIVPALGTGACLIGTTRAIDW